MNALFCVREVWQGFIRVVVLCLLSQITNFHSSKQRRTCQFEICYEQNVVAA